MKFTDLTSLRYQNKVQGQPGSDADNEIQLDNGSIDIIYQHF